MSVHVPTLLAVFIVLAALEQALSLGLLWRQARAAMRGRDAVPAAFRDRVTLADHRRAADYTTARARLGATDELAGFAVTIALVIRGADALASLVDGFRLPSFGADLLLLAAIAVIGGVPGTLVGAWRTLVLEQRFGFNRVTPRLFVADLCRRGLLAAALGLPLLALLLLAARDGGGFWWVYAWLGTVLLMVAAPVVYTRAIAPLFNRFERLGDPALAARIEALLARSGFASSGLWTMDASRRSSHGNAFFIGWGRTKRIVLFDTLLADRTTDEVAAIVAHELGHFRHGHVVSGTVRGALLTLLGFAAIGFLARQPALLPMLGFRHGGTALSLWAASLLLGLVTPLLAPLFNGISRRNEYQADDYARTAVGAGPMISALVGLSRDSASTLTPDPLYSLVRHTHPPVPLRVARLLTRSEAG